MVVIVFVVVLIDNAVNIQPLVEFATGAFDGRHAPGVGTVGWSIGSVTSTSATTATTATTLAFRLISGRLTGHFAGFARDRVGLSAGTIGNQIIERRAIEC
jgi:hypothetical protein